MGRPKKVEGPATDTGNAADDTHNIRDQAIFGNLSDMLAAARSKAAGGAAGAGKVASNAQPGLLPLKRVPTPAGAPAGAKAAATGTPAAAAAAGDAKAPGPGPGSSAAGSKRKAGSALAAPGGRKQARPVDAGPGASVPSLGRDGVPSLDGLRSWLAERMAALQERASASFGQQCSKAIEDGYNRVNELARQHHSTVSAMLQSSTEALEVARSQHSAAVADIEALRDGLLGELDSSREELLAALRSDVLGPMEAGVSGIQAKYKI